MPNGSIKSRALQACRLSFLTERESFLEKERERESRRRSCRKRGKAVKRAELAFQMRVNEPPARPFFYRNILSFTLLSLFFHSGVAWRLTSRSAITLKETVKFSSFLPFSYITARLEEEVGGKKFFLFVEAIFTVFEYVRAKLGVLETKFFFF